MNNTKQEEWDIIVIQEPYINPYGNIYSNCHFHIIYPTTKTTSEDRYQTTTLISIFLDTNSWTQIAFSFSNMVVVQITGPFGTCTLFNIYNSSDNNDTIIELDWFLNDNIRQVCPLLDDHIIWLGDFKRYHPLWEDEHNAHLLTNSYIKAAEPLIQMVSCMVAVRSLAVLWKSSSVMIGRCIGTWSILALRSFSNAFHSILLKFFFGDDFDDGTVRSRTVSIGTWSMQGPLCVGSV